MYFWKCWRDTRGAFYVFLILVLLMGIAGLAILSDVGGWTSRRAFPGSWYETARLLIATPLGFVYLAPFILGAVTLGEEYAKGTLPFLLTRPRQRSSLVWMSWLVGATALGILVFLSLAFLFGSPGPPAYPLGEFGFFVWRESLLTFLVPLFFYSLTFFMTMLFKSGHHGSGAALLITVAYLAMATWLSVSFEIRLPYAPGSFARYWNHFPWEEMAGWLTASTALVWMSRVLFERREV